MKKLSILLGNLNRNKYFESYDINLKNLSAKGDYLFIYIFSRNFGRIIAKSGSDTFWL